MNQPSQTVIVGQRKSMGVALILAFLFGPLGLLYASVAGGLILIVLGFVIGAATLGLALPIIWLASLVWAAIAVSSQNSKLQSSSTNR